MAKPTNAQAKILLGILTGVPIASYEGYYQGRDGKIRERTISAMLRNKWIARDGSRLVITPTGLHAVGIDFRLYNAAAELWYAMQNETVLQLIYGMGLIDAMPIVRTEGEMKKIYKESEVKDARNG